MPVPGGAGEQRHVHGHAGMQGGAGDADIGLAMVWRDAHASFIDKKGGARAALFDV